MNEASVRIDYFTGLDLGQAGEYTALAVLERTLGRDPRDSRRPAWRYAVRHLERFPLGTAYRAVLDYVAALFHKPPLEGTSLILDQTAVGRPVVDAFRRSPLRALVRAVVLTSGHSRTSERGCHGVPKRELASVLQMALQERRLQIADQLPHAQTLCQELPAFRPKVRVATDDTAEDWRERPHDDLVFAVALAVWMAERERAAFPETDIITLDPSLVWWEDGPAWERMC
jgi:hypothetical protein